MQASKVLCALLLLALPISANAGKQIDVESVADADSVGLISPWVQKRILDDEMEFRGIESFVRAQKPAALERAFEADVWALTSLAQIMRTDATKRELLGALSWLTERVPAYRQSSDAQKARGQLALRLSDLKTARSAYVLASDGAECTDQPSAAGMCSKEVQLWIATGEVAPAELDHTIDSPKIFDERQEQCAERSGINHEDLLLASGQARQAALLNLNIAWPSLLSGCRSFSHFDFSQAFDSRQLSQAFQEALASVQRRDPNTALVLGLDLKLPALECDFNAAPDCSIGKPLSAATAERIVRRLGSLYSGFEVEGGSCRSSSEEQRLANEAFEKRIKEELAHISAQPADTRATSYAALIGALSAEELQTLSYLLTAPLSMLARDGDALGAISVQQRLIEARGVDAKGYNLGLLAELELSARLPERALVSYERALARDHDDSYAQSAAQLRAYLAGAELPKAPPIKVDRPWVIVEDDETYVDWPSSEANPQVLRAMMGELPFVQFRTASGWLALTKTLAMFAMMSQSFEIEESMSTPEERSEGIAGAFGLDKLPPVEVLNASTVRLNGVEFPLPDGFCQEAGCSKPTRLSVDEYKELFAFLGFEVL